jgi:hypothetical protein
MTSFVRTDLYSQFLRSEGDCFFALQTSDHLPGMGIVRVQGEGSLECSNSLSNELGTRGRIAVA